MESVAVAHNAAQGMDTARRCFMVTAGLAALFPALAQATVVAQPDCNRDGLALWYDKPAGPWVEALPVGNGRLGAMIFGPPTEFSHALLMGAGWVINLLVAEWAIRRRVRRLPAAGVRAAAARISQG